MPTRPGLRGSGARPHALGSD